MYFSVKKEEGTRIKASGKITSLFFLFCPSIQKVCENVCCIYRQVSFLESQRYNTLEKNPKK